MIASFNSATVKEKIMTYNWRELLYPAEWGFRFFITSMLVALVFRFSTTESVFAFWALAAGCGICFLMQVRITILFILGKIPAPGLSST
ncbi:hypothetical protein [Methanogenium organophilum]|uniref:Uncharacterized protein n=1 Tax=Methanogenium organophilum TaxID=2199 RepID=A0A9X9S4G1_METOG|nr:hypothetical protein [Methanogenium organophilum]WAI01356.1 hypothetical protein OU421_00325 [Methanogenium organophilum]